MDSGQIGIRMAIIIGQFRTTPVLIYGFDADMGQVAIGYEVTLQTILHRLVPRKCTLYFIL